LGQFRLFQVLDYSGRIALLLGIVLFAFEGDERRDAARQQRQQKHYQAWQAIHLARDSPGDAGRKDALEDLNRDGVTLAGLDITGAELPEAKLPGARLHGANLSHARLDRSVLDDAEFTEATLDGADLNNASLRNADLRWASLRNAFLVGADLEGALLNGADLEGADLRWANLTNAQVDGKTILRGATLQGATLVRFRGWRDLLDFKGTNVFVRSPPPSFVARAIERGAVQFDEHAKWQTYRTARGIAATTTASGVAAAPTTVPATTTIRVSTTLPRS
jgi:uncharacterized protein YjbI with pentapeptide repeats